MRALFSASRQLGRTHQQLRGVGLQFGSVYQMGPGRRWYGDMTEYTSPPKVNKKKKKKSAPVKRKKTLVDSEDKVQNTKAYRQAYYQKNRERLLERNKNNRATKNALAKVGIYTVGKKGRPAKKRADVDNDDDGGLTPEELQREIARHEKAHEEWLEEVEQNRLELLKMYENDVEEDENVYEEEEEEEEEEGELHVKDIVKVLRKHQALDVVTLDLRHKTDLCDYKIIVTGSSPAHMRALTDKVFMKFKRHKEFHAMPRVEGRTNPDWVLIDCQFVMIHIFSEPTRKRYNLEALWGLRPSADQLAMSNDYDWEDDLFPEFSEKLYEEEEDDDDFDY